MGEIAVTPEDAFEVIQVYLQERITEAQENGAEAMRDGNYDRVRDALAFVEQLTAVLKRVEKIEKEFDKLTETSRDTSESDRLRKGLKTPEESYYAPILESLNEMGGSGEADDVLRRVYDKMAATLNAHDLALLPSQRDYRWRNTAMWARYALAQEGLVKNDSPRGMWEITDKGRRQLQR